MIGFWLRKGAIRGIRIERKREENVYFYAKISEVKINRSMTGRRKPLQRKGLRSARWGFSWPQGVGRCPFAPAIYTVSTAPDFLCKIAFQYPSSGLTFAEKHEKCARHAVEPYAFFVIFPGF
jgi:hypothetical protein